ncbi:MAG: S1 RNA-binding domain-containing protein [Planctomycetota bacterium]
MTESPAPERPEPADAAPAPADPAVTPEAPPATQAPASEPAPSAAPEATATASNEPAEPTEAQLQAELDSEVAQAGEDFQQLMAAEEQAAQAPAPAPAADTETPAPSENAPADQDPGVAEPVSGGEPKHLEMRRGRISAIRGDDVFVDLAGDLSPTGAKLQGIAPAQQFERAPRIGSIMDFVVDRVDEKQGLMFLSREGAASRATWDQLRPGAVIEARVTGHNKGGLELELVGGIKAFMPASQIDTRPTPELEVWVGQTVPARVTELDLKRKKVVLSRRAHLEDKRKRDRVRLLAELKPGDLRDGKVTSLTDFGAFVDIGGIEGLVHITDLAYTRVEKPGDIVQVDQEVRVKVLKIDSAKNRLALGLKQAAPNPWEGVEGRLQPGAEVQGTVTRTADFGAFVEIEEGLEALLPISEISWRRIRKVEDELQVGQAIRAKVLAMEPGKRRLTLSLKQLAEDPWTSADDTYAAGTQHQGKVTHLTDFGAFVELAPGVEGLVHISELADRRVERVADIVSVGDEKTFRIKTVDASARKLSLSLRTPRQGGGGGKRDRDERSGKYSDKELAKRARQPKINKGNLRGGMDPGGMGLGGLKLDDFQ